MTDQSTSESEPGHRLDLISKATVAIAAERSLPALLQRITDAAREVTGARYAALGVSGDGDEPLEFITAGIGEAERARIGPPPRGHGLLGVILHGTQPLRIANIADHPLSSGFPPQHPHMTSFLGAPILLDGRNLGNLYLTDKQGAAEFTEEDERLLMLLAAHAAVAIDGARLFDETNKALEQRLRELGEANAQLQQLTSKVITAQEEERRRIARELHDDTAQALTAILVRMRLLARRAGPADFSDGLIEVMDQLSSAIDGVRSLALDLRPSTLDDLGLGPAVESYAREFAGRWGIAVHTRVRGLDQRLSRDRELTVYRVVQEALTNVAKHAAATAVHVELRGEGDHLVATVRDNGRGLAPSSAQSGPDRGLGLFGMRERAQLAGGYLDLTGAPGSGTTVTLVVPMRDREDP